MDAEPSGLRRCNEAEPGQCLDPARRIALDAHLFVVGGAVPAMFAPLEHEEDGAQYLVPRGNDGTLVASAYDPGLQPGLEHATGASGGMGKLAPQTAQVGVSFAHVAAFSLARRWWLSGHMPTHEASRPALPKTSGHCRSPPAAWWP